MSRLIVRFWVFSAFIILFAATPSYAINLFFDDFDGPTLNPVWQAELPDAPWRFPQDTGIATYIGAPNYTFQSLDGASVIRLDSVLNNGQRVGWSSSQVFSVPDVPIVYAARFNTLTISASTSIDNFIEIWLLDSCNQANYDKVNVNAPGFGTQRFFNTSTSITDYGLDTGIEPKFLGFTFADNTWYRLVITGSRTAQVRAAIYDDSGQSELMGADLGHTLSAYEHGFRIGISQSMGRPNAPYPTAVAIDSVAVYTQSSSILPHCDFHHR
jgi:hypothetical protein